MKMTNILACAALGFSLMAGAAVAQQAGQPQPEVKRIGDFMVRCYPVKSVAPCDLYEDRVNKESGQRIVSLSLAYMPSSSRYILAISVPLGVSIDKGLIITGTGYTSPPLPFRRCDGGGCYVEAAVPKDMVDQFAKLGSDVKIRVTPDSGQVFDFPFSFDGFTAAHDEMVASNKTKAMSAEALQAAQAAAAPAK